MRKRKWYGVINITLVLTAIILVLITAFLISPLVTLAQGTWGSDQLIEDNAEYDGYLPQVAISGSSAVAVWRQHDGSSNRIYSSYSGDGGATWESDQLIEDNDGYHGYDPQVAISGSSAVAVWRQQDGSKYRIYSNYSSDGGATWALNDQLIEDNALYSGSDPQVAISGLSAVAVWEQQDADLKYRIYSN